jgi:hypothetical protein
VAANLQDTNNDKRKVESAICDKMKKLVVVEAVVGAGWWFLL